MPLRPKALLVGAVTVALLCALATAASANNISFRNSLGTRTWTSTWSPLEFTGPFGTTQCTLTLEGSFHAATFAKVRGSLLGYVTGARTGGCAILAARVLTETLPWHVRYRSFTGVLPNFSSVGMDIVGFAFQVRESGAGITCLMRSEVEQPLLMSWRREAGGGITSSELAGSIVSSDCGITGTFGGTARVTPSASLTLI